jgi:formimidoylglutamate deiminase
VSSSVIAPYALLPGGWAADVRIVIDTEGTIASITPDSPCDGATLLNGPAVAGMPNVHSHAFQRAFAGRAERSFGGDDSFWTWRQAMYGLAARITPEDLEAIAAQLYVEMLEAGYTAVGEFHYIHHDLDGRPYAQRSEMGQRLLGAADEAGIGITLLPAFYRWSGFAKAPPLPEQTRFVNDLPAYLAIIDELAPLCRAPGRRLGIAPHSLRAVGADDLRAVLAALDERDPDAPVHLHIAEQTGEVEAAMEAYGMRPVAWLTEHVALSPRWCLIHATHSNAAEIDALAASGAAVGLSPTTEGNLGDGIFPLAAWLAAGGATAIGSDSHVSVDVGEELRWLEYGQRLRSRRRTIAPSPHALYVDAARFGGRALGRPVGTLTAGARADFVVLDAADPALCGDIATLLDRYVIAGGRHALRDVYVGGVRVVEAGRHERREAIARRYCATLAKLAVAANPAAANSVERRER